MPYDRAKTTMREFAMCEECRAEYENPSRPPLSRRAYGLPLAARGFYSARTQNGRELADGDDAINLSRLLLLNGKILAIKGVGGFHLACDALKRRGCRAAAAKKIP